MDNKVMANSGSINVSQPLVIISASRAMDIPAHFIVVVKDTYFFRKSESGGLLVEKS